MTNYEIEVLEPFSSMDKYNDHLLNGFPLSNFHIFLRCSAVVMSLHSKKV